ncbi:MAG: hypothetical protein COB13_012570 [OCS116 cluster bacterium]|nr:hypothetical protein [OCS116 cluster bacterium]
MVNFIKQFLRFTKLERLFDKPDSATNPTIDSYEDLDLTENLALETVDLVLAINENSVVPAKNLATKKASLIIVDLNHLPNADNQQNPRFKAALSAADLVFSANRKLATALEIDFSRHITISRHVQERKVQNKYIDLKKVFHLIDDTQLIIFDAKICHPFLSQPHDLLKHNFTFIATLLGQLPRHIHIIVTGSRIENKIFDQHKNIFDKYNCASRVHFYTENLEAIKYPIDYGNIDIALLLGDQDGHTPNQYYKYLHEQVAIFATEFADANQLVTSANIGQIFDDTNLNEWTKAILTFLELSQAKRDTLQKALRKQKLHINWQRETEHFISSIMNIITTTVKTNRLSAVIVDLSKDQITDRTHDIGYMLVEQDMDVSILAPFLPVIHAPQSSNIEYIKVS